MYKLAPTDSCPLCGLPDSCTQIAGECKSHINQIINRHNISCQLTYSAIRIAFKGGSTIYSPHDLRPITMDTRTIHQTTDEDQSDLNIPSPRDQNDQPPPTLQDAEWLAPLGPPSTLRKNRRVDVSIETKIPSLQGEAETRDNKGAAVHTRLSPPKRRP